MPEKMDWGRDPELDCFVGLDFEQVPEARPMSCSFRGRWRPNILDVRLPRLAELGGGSQMVSSQMGRKRVGKGRAQRLRERALINAAKTRARGSPPNVVEDDVCSVGSSGSSLSSLTSLGHDSSDYEGGTTSDNRVVHSSVPEPPSPEDNTSCQQDPLSNLEEKTLNILPSQHEDAPAPNMETDCPKMTSSPSQDSPLTPEEINMISSVVDLPELPKLEDMKVIGKKKDIIEEVVPKKSKKQKKKNKNVSSSGSSSPAPERVFVQSEPERLSRSPSPPLATRGFGRRPAGYETKVQANFDHEEFEVYSDHEEEDGGTLEEILQRKIAVRSYEGNTGIPPEASYIGKFRNAGRFCIGGQESYGFDQDFAEQRYSSQAKPVIYSADDFPTLDAPKPEKQSAKPTTRASSEPLDTKGNMATIADLLTSKDDYEVRSNPGDIDRDYGDSDTEETEKRGFKQEPNTIVIENLPLEYSMDSLEELLSMYGTVLSCKMYPSSTGKNAIVRFDGSEACEWAVASLHNTEGFFDAQSDAIVTCVKLS